MIRIGKHRRHKPKSASTLLSRSKKMFPTGIEKPVGNVQNDVLMY